MTDFAPDAVMSFFEQTQRAKERRARLWGGVAPRRVNKPMPEPEVRSEPVEQKITTLTYGEQPIDPPQISVRLIVQHVAAFYKIPIMEIMSPRRNMQAVWPRWVAMHLARKLTARSLPEIGRRIGGRDHTTVMNGLARVRKTMDADGRLSADVAALAERITRAAAAHRAAAVNDNALPVIEPEPQILIKRRKTFHERTSWTEEMTSALEKRWRRGDDIKDMARYFGVTRKAVIGKAWRMRLPSRRSPANRSYSHFLETRA
jgi:hypothetical protein